MMAAFFLFLLLSAIFTAEAINPGSSLTPKTNPSWPSPSGQYAFGFYKQGDGFAVGIFLAKIPQTTVVWTANRDNAPVPADVTLNFTSDGRMVLQSAQGKEITKVVNFVSAASACMNDTGNFVLYDSDNQTILWESFKNPTDTILPTQQLSADAHDKNVLVSSVSESNHSTGLFCALVQQDGYLALYPNGKNYTRENGYWSQGVTGPLLNATLNLGGDGYLYLASGSNTVTLSTAKNSTKGILYLLRMDADGFLKLFSHNMDQNGTWLVTWSAPATDQIVPTGQTVPIDQTAPTDQTAAPKEGKKEVRVDILIISVSLVSFAFIVMAISGIVIYRSRVENISSNKKIVFSDEDSNKNIVLSDKDVGPQSFTYAELERVTDNFKEKLGEGSSGIVYKGAIENGKKVVAVKRLKEPLVDRARGFQTEMEVIGRRQHKNLICLLGYCNDGPNRLLVYEYMSNGSLEDILFKPGNKPCWDKRMEIACNVAKGILYLHEDCMPQIIHCDIKPQNILMDENMCAKISDFGLAKLLKPDQSRTSTDLRGTTGYVAPEWRRKESVTIKVDVYSFGIVLLEIICCRKRMDCNVPKKECILEELVYNCFACGELSNLVNDEDVDKTQLEGMIKVALWCILDRPSLRPSMKKVLLWLEGTITDIPSPPNPTSVLSVI